MFSMFDLLKNITVTEGVTRSTLTSVLVGMNKQSDFQNKKAEKMQTVCMLNGRPKDKESLEKYMKIYEERMAKKEEKKLARKAAKKKK